MLKRILIIFTVLFLTFNMVFAADIPVKVETLSKISTSDGHLQEGDNINFVVADDIYVDSKLLIKKGESVTGVITSLVNNDFTCQSASIYAENFKARTIDGKIVKLNGIVYKEGRNHSFVTQYLENGFQLIRGGEAQILPKKDSFMLYLKEDHKPKKETIDDL